MRLSNFIGLLCVFIFVVFDPALGKKAPEPPTYHPNCFPKTNIKLSACFSRALQNTKTCRASMNLTQDKARCLCLTWTQAADCWKKTTGGELCPQWNPLQVLADQVCTIHKEKLQIAPKTIKRILHNFRGLSNAVLTADSKSKIPRITNLIEPHRYRPRFVYQHLFRSRSLGVKQVGSDPEDGNVQVSSLDFQSAHTLFEHLDFKSEPCKSDRCRLFGVN